MSEHLLPEEEPIGHGDEAGPEPEPEEQPEGEPERRQGQVTEQQD